jgi:phosphopantetheinyl transferase
MSNLRFSWLSSGKPVVEGCKGGEQVQISLAHDSQFCICVAGYGIQGCDIEPITRRSENEWFRLIGNKRGDLLNCLLIKDIDPLDRAGTRIWTAMESLRKAKGFELDLQISLCKSYRDTVLFFGGVDSNLEEVKILTFPIKLSRGVQRMIAIVVA